MKQHNKPEQPAQHPDKGCPSTQPASPHQKPWPSKHPDKKQHGA